MANPRRPDTPVREKVVKMIAENRRAWHEYSISQEIEAGVMLVGTEVKSLRDGKAQLSDGFALISAGELWLENVHIGIFKQGNRFNHEEKRRRKLLIHKKELEKLGGKLKDAGVTLVPLKLYFKGNKVKVLIGVGRGKKAYDKRASIKERDMKREMSREDS
jgi:SsrA-binding protein